MPISKPDFNLIFASQAPSQDLPAAFNNYARGWDEARKNNGKPTIKQFNYLIQQLDLKALWMIQNGAALPFDETVDYAEGAFTVKDGSLQQFIGGIWRKPAQAADQIIDESGLSQQGINDKLELNFDLFNADPSGVVASDSALIQAFTTSKLSNRPIRNSAGVYLVDGSQDIIISNTAFLSGTTFKIGSNFTGKILINNSETIEHDENSSIVSLLKTQGTLAAGSCFWSVLESNQELDNSYLEIHTSQPMFYFRSVVQNRIELNRLLKSGQMLSPLFYDLDCSLITKVYQQVNNDNVLTLDGLTIDETLSKTRFVVESAYSNNVVISNIKYVDNAPKGSRTTNQSRIMLRSSHATLVKNIDTSSVVRNSNNTYNYTVLLQDCYDLTFDNVTAEGDGWGAIGGNDCQRVVIKNSNLNRIDFHRPCKEYMKVENNNIGSWGVLFSQLGDLYISNNRFVMRDTSTGNRGILRTREDSGSVNNGRLFWKDNTITGTSSATVAFLRVDSKFSVPVGSPIRSNLFDEIYIDGLYTDENNDWLGAMFASRLGSTNLNQSLPNLIDLKNIKLKTNLNLLMIPNNSYAKNNSGVVINIEDSNIPLVDLNDNTMKGTEYDINITNSKGIGFREGIQLKSTANANFNIVNSNIKQYSEYIVSAWTTYSPSVIMLGGILGDSTANILVNTNRSSAQSFITAIGVKLAYLDVNFSANLRFFETTSCRFNGSQKLTLWSGDTTAPQTLQLPSVAKIRLVVGTGYDSASNALMIFEDIRTTTKSTYDLQNCTVVIVPSGPTSSITVTPKSGSPLRSIELTS